MNRFPWYIALIFGILLLSHCKKDNARPEIPQETIDGLTLKLVASDNSDSTLLSFSDPDGDGGMDPVITGGSIKVSTVYIGIVSFFNGTTDVTESIRETAEDHQIFFSASSQLGLIFTYEDQDGDGRPVGILSSWTSYSKGSGLLRVSLIHQPDKAAQGVAQGNLNTAGGKTDIEVDFPITIK
ncbi:MAG: type 1 periplasmic binding fold superfamily protein [Saprospiraceae bacterium]|nr:type 1 periplasmic binding fold superfamily protein [Saprospiraceae bacterium]MCB9317783.1 type 1 periplasmic binding fold superfamily protein [Lewinellaceae bacterium]